MGGSVERSRECPPIGGSDFAGNVIRYGVGLAYNVVQTDTYWYVYRMLGNVKSGDRSVTNSQGVPGREIVDPSDTGVVDPVPNHPGERPTLQYMTMTTCMPTSPPNE